MCTSWWPCWESVWRDEWLGRGTAPGIPLPWVLWAECGRRSGTCCLPLVVVCGSPLQLEKRKKLELHIPLATGCVRLCLWVLCNFPFMRHQVEFLQMIHFWHTHYPQYDRYWFCPRLTSDNPNRNLAAGCTCRWRIIAVFLNTSRLFLPLSSPITSGEST